MKNKRRRLPKWISTELSDNTQWYLTFWLNPLGADKRYLSNCRSRKAQNELIEANYGLVDEYGDFRLTGKASEMPSE